MIVTIGLVAVTALLSIQTMNDYSAKRRFMFNAYAIRHRKEWWRFFTHGVLHAGWEHLIFNMISLVFFGMAVENWFAMEFHPWGRLLFLLMYLLALVASSLFDFEKHKHNMHYNALGASGAVSAVIFSSILIYPMGKITFFIIPNIPAWIFGIIYLAVSSILAKRGQDNIGHSAHFWGGVFGLVFTAACEPSLVPALFDAISGFGS